MTKLVRICAVILLIVPAHLAAGQVAATFSGVITDSSGVPIPGVNVFIAGSMTGTVTDDDGRYRLSGIPLGTLRLAVSRVGYTSQHQDVFVREARVYTFDFQLEIAVYEIGEITVAADNKRWKRQLERFTRVFIGETPWAAKTEINNSEVLDFSSKGGDFRAQASEPLVIENRALGYKLTYFLNEFVAHPTGWRWDGEPLFEPLAPGSPEEAAHWNARRDSAFYGSFRHFLLAVLNDQVEQQGFIMYSRPGSGRAPGAATGGGFGRGALQGNQRFPITAQEIIRPGEGANERILDFKGFIEIVYTQELEDKAFLRLEQQGFRRPRYQTSMIRLDKGPTIIDLKGDTLDPYGVTFYGGYFAYERVANQVPKEYRPWID